MAQPGTASALRADFRKDIPEIFAKVDKTIFCKSREIQIVQAIMLPHASPGRGVFFFFFNTPILI